MVVATTDVWPNTAGFDTNYEENEPVSLTVKGTIPKYAAGVLYRTGPLGYKAKTDDGKVWAAKHWFDGFSCVHRFQIDATPHAFRSMRKLLQQSHEHVRINTKRT